MLEIDIGRSWALAAMRKKELRYFRRLEGVGRDIEESGAMNTTSTPARDTQSIADFPIREDVEEEVPVVTLIY